MDGIKLALAAIALELNAMNAITLMEAQPKGPNHAAAILKHTSFTAERLKLLNTILSGKEIDDEHNLSE